MPHQNLPHQNSILAALSPATLEKIKPHLRQTDLKQLGSVVFETRGIIEHVYFPHSGIISLVVELKEGDMLETAMVGKDGVLGASSALDGKVSLNKAIVQGCGRCLGDEGRQGPRACQDG